MMLETIVAACMVQACATNITEARRIEAQRLKCIQDLSDCLEKTSDIELAEERRFQVCLTVRNKYGRVVVPALNKPNDAPSNGRSSWSTEHQKSSVVR